MKKLIFILPLLFAFAGLQGQGAMFLRGSQPAPEPGAGILDSYLGAAFAAAPDVLMYSAHSVTDNTVGSQTEGQTGQFTVLVRRDNDDALRSFTYTEVADGTLTTWVGPANNGFVKILYDQSTNGNHATQTTAANQPKIVDAGSLVVENGKAAIDHSGNKILIATGLGATNTTRSYFHVTKTQQSSVIARGNGANQALLIAVAGNGSTSIATDLSNLLTYLNGNSVTYTNRNNVYTSFSVQKLSAIIADFSSNWDTYATSYGGLFGINGFSFQQLSLVYTTDQSANRAAIETAINTEYNIY